MKLEKQSYLQTNAMLLFSSGLDLLERGAGLESIASLQSAQLGAVSGRARGMAQRQGRRCIGLQVISHGGRCGGGERSGEEGLGLGAVVIRPIGLGKMIRNDVGQRGRIGASTTRNLYSSRRPGREGTEAQIKGESPTLV
jgi:hypothetical protein